MAAKLSSLNLSCMPRDDAGAEMWLTNFAASLAKHESMFGLWGVTREQSERITQLAEAFDEALLVARSPSSNSRPNIEAKTSWGAGPQRRRHGGGRRPRSRQDAQGVPDGQQD